jgi:putative ABC transport system permease protein
VLQGHWPDAAGQIGVSQRFLLEHGLAVGDRVTLEKDGHRAPMQIVAKVLISTSQVIFADWSALDTLAPGARPDIYNIKLDPGTDRSAYLRTLESVDGFMVGTAGGADAAVILILATVTLLTLMLAAIAALGVFNTVVLNTQERRRDLGLLKSIGMTPRQVVVMVVTSMSALGAVGALIGIPLGILGLHAVVPAMADAAQIVITDAMLRVYHLPLLALLALAGVAIAALGAFLPARAAARITVAEALRNE